MELTQDQVLKLAPDASSAAAGKKLASIRNWQSLGRDTAALWGLCQGSAVYQVRVDFSNLGSSCSCPSRKFPCKHVIALLLLVAQAPEAVAEGEPPDWVTAWLEKRRATAAKKADAQQAKEAKPVDEKAQAKRAEDRDRRVREGLERLDLWIRDLVRGGLAGLETQPAKFWDEQAKRLVDAQAPGLAGRLQRLATIPGSAPDWPRRLLGELGSLKLAIHAYDRLDQLEPALREDLRQLIGWSVKEEDLARDAEQVADEWLVFGQSIDDDDRVRAQRSWIVGKKSGRTALVLQFAPFNMPFAESIVPGTAQRGVLAFYPGAAKQRAKFLRREGAITSWTRAGDDSPQSGSANDRIPGHDTVSDFLSHVAAQLGRSPWLTSVGYVLHNVTLVVQEDRWAVRDRAGEGLPLRGSRHWTMLAVSAGRPVDLTGEWDGRHLRPLGIVVDGRFRVVQG